MVIVSFIISPFHQLVNDTYGNSNGVYQPSDHASTVLQAAAAGRTVLIASEDACVAALRLFLVRFVGLVYAVLGIGLNMHVKMGILVICILSYIFE